MGERVLRWYRANRIVTYGMGSYGLGIILGVLWGWVLYG